MKPSMKLMCMSFHPFCFCGVGTNFRNFKFGFNVDRERLRSRDRRKSRLPALTDCYHTLIWKLRELTRASKDVKQVDVSLNICWSDWVAKYHWHSSFFKTFPTVRAVSVILVKRNTSRHLIPIQSLSICSFASPDAVTFTADCEEDDLSRIRGFLNAEQLFPPPEVSSLALIGIWGSCSRTKSLNCKCQPVPQRWEVGLLFFGLSSEFRFFYCQLTMLVHSRDSMR